MRAGFTPSTLPEPGEVSTQLQDNVKPSLHNGTTSTAAQLYNLVNPEINSLLKVFAGK